MNTPNPVYDPNNVQMHVPESTNLQSEKEVKHFSVMPIILVGLILILVGILGALLWWGLGFMQTPEVATPTPTTQRPTAAQNNEPESTNAEADITGIQAVSSSDELSAIQADLFGTDIDGLDPEVPIIDRAVGI